MPVDFNGTWKHTSNHNFDNYMKALGIDFAIRKIASIMKPQKVIEQNCDSFTIRTTNALQEDFVQFRIGECFEEDNKSLDNRKCKSLVTWDNHKLVCIQTGEKSNRGWTHWIEGDNLYLELRCEDQVCKQVYKRA
ncbi:retinoid-binding protein 7-like [Alligator mississippiensis]|uniref:retinoid-binding protein 7-like n=1 Tax=Alligator mississippiensis TaxID=8496 RepID=UPI00287731F8|nr:retinoid-binding protein 7-like [Alligator mississippiensis]